MKQIRYSRVFKKTSDFYTDGGLQKNNLTGNEYMFAFSDRDHFPHLLWKITSKDDLIFLKIWQMFWDYKGDGITIKPWKT